MKTTENERTAAKWSLRAGTKSKEENDQFMQAVKKWQQEESSL
ncbi:hypothetical protein KR50_00280 [Jeotgalibacillus campisalis]|uniref:Uncharacterized protein n=1 Tax=Jeotgalibacillus campisalis TaxID=220754 RepID=A0A0C2SFK0_9BACL|nr:hypothetical protein KR50_00280 [Jeotgalibacillus campisalis]